MPSTKPRQKKKLCYCKAYPFPHRAGGGKCSGPGEYICEYCGQVADGAFVDLGIGPYECRGTPGFDTNVQWVSRCCEATLLENTPSKCEACCAEDVLDTFYTGE